MGNEAILHILTESGLSNTQLAELRSNPNLVMETFAGTVAGGKHVMFARSGCCGRFRCKNGELTPSPQVDVRRLAEIPRSSSGISRRLAAIPLPKHFLEPRIQEPEVQTLEEPVIESSNAGTLGVLTSAVICAGCLIKRYYRAIKDSLANTQKEL